MTKKDKAIEWFTMLKEKFAGTEYGEYLDMAIKTLEQEPCEDAISRKAAIDAFNAFADEVNQDTDIHEAIEIVLNLPPVTPQPKEVEE